MSRWPKRKLGNRISEAFHNFFYGMREKLAEAMDYFEWLFHQGYEGLGTLFIGVGSLFFPRKLIDRIRKKRVRRAEERAEDLEARGAGKFIETLEYLFHQFTSGIAAFFVGLYQLIVPAKLIESTEKTVAHKTADAIWDVRHRLKMIGENIAPKWLRRRVGWFYDALAAWFTFIGAWAISRDFRKLTWAVPAMMLSMPLVGSLVYSAVYSKTHKIRHYQRALSSAIELRDENTEQLCFGKLAQLGFERTERNEFEAAYALSQDEGKWNEAIQRMQRIAPIDEPGYAPAHLWLAANMLNGKIDGTEIWELTETHASHALELSTGRERRLRVNALSIMVEVDLHFGRVERAIEKMEELASRVPVMHIGLMEQYMMKDDIPNATKHARGVDEFFTALVSEQTGDVLADEPIELTKSDYYLRWAYAQYLLGKTARAVEILEQGQRALPEVPEVRRALIAMLEKQMSQSPLSDLSTLSAMKQVLKLDSRNRAAIGILVRGVLDDNEHVERYIQALEADELLSAEILVTLGDEEANQPDYVAAARYYKKACQIDPLLSRAWNNLGWVRGNAEPTDLKEAVIAATTAISIDPRPRYLETRGQLFVKLKRWPEAVQDLERALNGALPNNMAVHEALAKAYQELGDSEQAAAHRNIIDSLR